MLLLLPVQLKVGLVREDGLDEFLRNFTEHATSVGVSMAPWALQNIRLCSEM